MKIQSVISFLILVTCLLALAPAVHAEDESPNVVYQTTFSTDPKWITNNPSTNYWDSNRGMYHFSIEPSTGCYVYIPVEYERGPFKLEYDVTLDRLDDGATFRLGFSGAEMDPGKGPMVLSQFTNAKFGRIMWLHLVTNGNKMVEVNSQKGDTLSSGPKGYYDGPTVKYELNKTYHVTVDYDSANKLLSMKVNEKTSGKDVWSYYVNVAEDLHGMNRIFLGSKGDYGMTSIYAKGYIDNVRLTTPVVAGATPTESVTAEVTPVNTQPTAKTPTQKPVTTMPTAIPAETPQSPSSVVLPVAALGIAGVCMGMLMLRRRE
jgi:hypothetical protein